MRPRISVVGSYGVGLTFGLSQVPAAGETVACRYFRREHGGKGSNQAVAAARLGADVRLCTALGDDAFAEGARRLWADEGINARAVICPGESTMIGAILVESDGENRIVIAPGALARFVPEHLDASDVAASAVLLVQLEIPVLTAMRALELGAAEGALTILNPAPVSSDALNVKLLAAADVLTPNLKEAQALLGGELADPSAAASHLAEAANAAVVLTAGALGAYVASRGVVTHVPSEAVGEVVDTTGAGDAFTGALGVALAEGADMVEAARFASLAAARCICVNGVIRGLPRREELELT
jgi:ribokinase